MGIHEDMAFFANHGLLGELRARLDGGKVCRKPSPVTAWDFDLPKLSEDAIQVMREKFDSVYINRMAYATDSCMDMMRKYFPAAAKAFAADSERQLAALVDSCGTNTTTTADGGKLDLSDILATMNAMKDADGLGKMRRHVDFLRSVGLPARIAVVCHDAESRYALFADIQAAVGPRLAPSPWEHEYSLNGLPVEVWPDKCPAGEIQIRVLVESTSGTSGEGAK